MLDRNALFEQNLRWSAVIARNVHRKLPPSFDLCDLEQTARIALWKFIEQKYDPALNDTVQGAAYLAVRGAVLMSVRRKAFRENTRESLSIPVSKHLTSGGGIYPNERPVIDERPNPEQQMLRAEESPQHRLKLIALLHLIKALPVEQRYLIRRVFLNDVDVETVARTWGVPRNQVSRQLHSAVRTLRMAATDPAAAKRICRGGWLFMGSGRMMTK